MKANLMVGPLVIFVGLVLLAGNLHLLAMGEVWRYWPVLLMALGLHFVLRRRCGCGRRCLCEGGNA